MILGKFMSPRSVDKTVQLASFILNIQFFIKKSIVFHNIVWFHKFTTLIAIPL